MCRLSHFVRRLVNCQYAARYCTSNFVAINVNLLLYYQRGASLPFTADSTLVIWEFVACRDRIRKNLSVPANKGCSGIPGFPYTPSKQLKNFLPDANLFNISLF